MLTPTGNTLDQPPGRPTLQLLGGVALHGVPADVADPVLKQSKAVALAAYLLLSPPGAYQRRDRIVWLLWPEQDQQRARAALRKAIHIIRAQLGEHVLMTRGDEELTVNHELLTCDAVQLRAAVERGELARAVELYGGDLMPGFHFSDGLDFDSWLEDRRRELHELAMKACLDLAHALESEQNGTHAGSLARKAARMAGTNERVLRRCMIMLDRLGDRAGALQVYDEFAQRLRLQMDAAPSPESAKLAESLRAHQDIP